MILIFYPKDRDLATALHPGKWRLRPNESPLVPKLKYACAFAYYVAQGTNKIGSISLLSSALTAWPINCLH